MHRERVTIKNIRHCKNEKFLKGLILSFIIIFMGLNGSSQTLEIGLFGGGSYYIGDLNTSIPFVNTQPAYGLVARYNLDERWAVKFGATQGKIKGSSAGTSFLPDRGLSFESTVTDFSVVVEFNFFKYFTGSKVNWITPYVFAGAGAFFYNPTSGGVSLRAMGTEGQNIGYLGRKPYSLTALSFPFGIGAKVSLTRKLSLGAYWEMHKTFTDYLDDVSSTYYLNGASINPAVPEEYFSDPLRTHDKGMQRGNPKSNDWFSFAGVTLTYSIKLHSTKKCRDLKHY